MTTNARSDAEIDAQIAAWLRSGAPGEGVDKIEASRLLFRIDLNGVGPMLAHQTAITSLPETLVNALRHRLMAREMWEEQHKRVVKSALTALTDAGLQPILMKGTALAYSHYDPPSIRVRGDSDILIEEEGRQRAIEALKGAGFHRHPMAGGDTFTAETLFQMPDLSGLDHDIDLHWRLNSSPVIASLFDHAEFLGRADTLDALGPAALRLCDIDALLYAAVHRRKHVDRPTHIYLNSSPHPVIDSLSWLADIDVLYRTLDADAREVLTERALDKGIADILSDGLRSARDRLGTVVDGGLVQQLDQAKEGRIARYIAASPVQALSMDLSAMHGLKARITFLCELFLPPKNYVRSRFAKGRFDWLPVLYARRYVQLAKKAVFNK